MNRKMKDMSLILNLPSEIIIDILSRLTLRTIISCKCVCKKWLNLISSPEFAKSHLPKSSPCLIVNGSQCKMFEFEDELELLDQDHDLHYKPVMEFEPNKVGSSPNAKIWTGSVNGLLCLLEFSCELDAFHICNPITNEYISLPLLPKPKHNSPLLDIVTYGIGICVLSGQYKVIRIFQHEPTDGSRADSRLNKLMTQCMVYTLGTSSWRSIEPNEVYEYDVRASVGAFLNRNLHWLVGDSKGSLMISCFDLETELFKSFPPPFPSYFPLIASLTIVGDCLCLCNFILDEEIEIWLMKEYGVKESWTKEFVISVYPDLGGLNSDTFYALKVFKDGVILMLWLDTCLFYHCKKTETNPSIDLFERDHYGSISALIHTPSFVSLKNFKLECKFILNPH